ncbi:hypothetical protein ACSBM8_03675 [Sphingomonas sp. ASY06-1R]|jgi:hypothetical protein|uniref:hypothetical protein n=1 Tax=Sphingomonas sp. ASY06-1R TaxID=3445771 RepID=UPI003FA2DA48
MSHRSALFAACAAIGLFLSGCSGAEPAADQSGGNSVGLQAPTQQVDHTVAAVLKAEFIPTRKKCASDALAQTSCMIQLILEDLDENYSERYAGGISRVKMIRPMTFAVYLPQEERVDIFTYVFERRGDRIAIKSKVIDAEM